MVGLTACHSGEHATPPLDKPAPTVPAATRPNLLERTAHATVSALETPVHWIDKKLPVAPAAAATASSQPAEALIVSRHPSMTPAATNP